MPRINITEHSETYSFQVRNNNYATVALPICAIWGPAFVADDEDNNPDWLHFEAGYRGTTDFLDTFKGPNPYLGPRDKSFDYAVKLLSAGYDILVKRTDGVGLKSQGSGAVQKGETADDDIRCVATAKYPGTYGDRLRVVLQAHGNATVGSVTIYEQISTGNRKLLEIKNVALVDSVATETMPIISDVDFEYINHLQFGKGSTTLVPVSPSAVNWAQYLTTPFELALGGGTDSTPYVIGTSTAPTAENIMALVNDRLNDSGSAQSSAFKTYMSALTSTADAAELKLLYNQQILYSRFEKCLEELTDPICYNWDVVFNALIDDQYVPKSYLETLPIATRYEYKVTSTMLVMADVAQRSKCGCAFIGLPFNCPRGTKVGNAPTGALMLMQELSDDLVTGRTHVVEPNEARSTFAELVGPWCKTTLAYKGENSWVTPELAHLLLIINADGIGGINKWWMVPAGMTSTGVVYTPEYKIKKSYLDLIQNHDEGVCLNPLMEVPGKGFTCFGNSTLWDKPLGTYNALQNLSTRLLCNRVKQRIWDVALQILFKYNNENAYSHFYAGLSPLLDEMRSVGALTGNEDNPLGYKIIMNPDIINLDRINANTVIGKVYLAVTGVIDTVNVDLFLLPPTGFMESYD